MPQEARPGWSEPVARPSVADTIFDELHRQILTLGLPPGTKMSEIEVARAMGVSRQPVRDAFYRLSKLGFLNIRPQRSTTVSRISGAAVMRARFVREALERSTVAVACRDLTSADIDALHALIERQRVAVEATSSLDFHDLDDRFHREICERTGHGFAWDIIRENKAHMDRVRFLSLSFARSEALGDHVRILDAIAARDTGRATAAISDHLSRIREQFGRIRAENEQYFEEDAAIA